MKRFWMAAFWRYELVRNTAAVLLILAKTPAEKLPAENSGSFWVLHRVVAKFCEILSPMLPSWKRTSPSVQPLCFFTRRDVFLQLFLGTSGSHFQAKNHFLLFLSVNIRGGRQPPGMKPQHAIGVQLVSDIYSAQTHSVGPGTFVLFAFKIRNCNQILVTAVLVCGCSQARIACRLPVLLPTKFARAFAASTRPTPRPLAVSRCWHKSPFLACCLRPLRPWSH